jgi:ribosomal protein S18 acetylase RimI-like enzyme
LGPSDAAVLDRVAPDVFEKPLEARLLAEFLSDARHYLAIAIDDGLVVGMASGVHYLCPDKPAEMFVNEVGVTPEYQNRGIGRRLLGALFERAKALGCREAWLGTDVSNAAARRMYAAAGGMERPMILVAFDLWK